MYYINSKPTENGNYGTPSSLNEVILPDEFLAYYIECKGFVNVTIEENEVKEISKNEDAYTAYMEEHPDIPDEQEPESQDKENEIWDEIADAIREGVNEVD